MSYVIYDVDIAQETVDSNLSRISNQIFKLLPMREEGKDWIKPLETLIIEITGMSVIFSDQKLYLSLLCKLEGLKSCTEDSDFMLYRRTVFECCGLVNEVKNQCQ